MCIDVQPAKPAEMKIGLALSGGGFRSSIFHLGVLLRLEELGVMPNVTVISAVSGGSIIAAYYACEMEKELRLLDPKDWTDSKERTKAFKKVACRFLEKVRLNMRSRALVFTPFYHPLLFVKSLALRPFRKQARSILIQKEYDLHFYHDSTLDQLPAVQPGSERVETDKEMKRRKDCGEHPQPILTGPKLILNTTSLMTGDRKAFSRDANTYLAELKSSNKNVLKLSQVVGASAGVPVLFPPTAICGELLVDGGISDNQGVEGLLPLGPKYAQGAGCPPPEGHEPVDVLLISDASGQLQLKHTLSTSSVSVFSRINEILQYQVRGKLLDLVKVAKERGKINFAFVHLYLNLKDGGDDARIPAEFIEPLARTRTDLDQFSFIEAELLMYHGYTLIDAMLRRWTRDGLIPNCNDKLAEMRTPPVLRKHNKEPGAAKLIQEELAQACQGIFLVRCFWKFGWKAMTPIYGAAVVIWILILALLFHDPHRFVEPAVRLWSSWMPSTTRLADLGSWGTSIKDSLDKIVHGFSELAGVLTVVALPGYVVLWALFATMHNLALVLDRRRYKILTGGADPEALDWDSAPTKPPVEPQPK